jgi:hypothetical protein
MIISRWSFLRTRNVSDKTCRENQNTSLFWLILFYFSKVVPFMRYCGENIV